MGVDEDAVIKPSLFTIQYPADGREDCRPRETVTGGGTAPDTAPPWNTHHNTLKQPFDPKPVNTNRRFCGPVTEVDTAHVTFCHVCQAPVLGTVQFTSSVSTAYTAIAPPDRGDATRNVTCKHDTFESHHRGLHSANHGTTRDNTTYPCGWSGPKVHTRHTRVRAIGKKAKV